MISIKRWVWSGQEKVNMEIKLERNDEVDCSFAVYFIEGHRVSADVFNDVVGMLAVPK